MGSLHVDNNNKLIGITCESVSSENVSFCLFKVKGVRVQTILA